MNTDDILDRLPFELAARLESDPFFASIPIVVAVKGNVAREFQRKQAIISEKGGKSGACVVVLQIAANDKYPGQPGGPMTLRPAFQVVENVEINNGATGTKKSARKIARHIVKNMKIAGFFGIIQALTCDTPAIEPVDVKELGEGCVSEQVNFTCMEFSDEKYLYCAPPVIEQVPGQPQITLSCATPGASTWYTTDDSFPYPGDKNSFPESRSQLYCEPVTLQLDQPVIIRAMADQPGYIASSIVRFTVGLT